MTTGTPALRTSHAQGTPTSAHLSRQQKVPTSAHKKPSTLKERLFPADESSLHRSAILGVKAVPFQPSDQENIPVPTNPSSKKLKAPPKRSITFSADTYTNDSPRTSARRLLNLRGDGASNPIPRIALESPSKSIKQVARNQHGATSQHLNDSDDGMLASVRGLGAESSGTVTGMRMGTLRQRLAPTPELSQEINVRSSVARETEDTTFRPWSREPEPLPMEAEEITSTRTYAESPSPPSKGRKSPIHRSPTSARGSSKRRVATAVSSTSSSPSKSPNSRARKNRRTTLGVSASLPEPLTSGPTTPIRSQRTKARAIPATDRPVRRRKSTIKPATRRSTGSNESTSDRLDRRSRRRSIAPDYLSKRVGTIDAPEPTSPGDDPLLLKGSLSRRKSTSRWRNVGDELQEMGTMVVDRYDQPSVHLTPQRTPLRRRIMKDVAMASPGTDSPSPSERTNTARRASKSASAPLAHSNSMLSPSPSRSSLAPGSANCAKSFALPILLGRALAHNKAMGISQEPHVLTSASRGSALQAQDQSAAYIADPVVQVVLEASSYGRSVANDAEDEREWEYEADQEEEHREAQAGQHFEEEVPSAARDGIFTPPPSGQQPVNFNEAEEQVTDVWMAEDEWLMNERESATPPPKPSPMLEEKDEDGEQNLEGAIIMSPQKGTRPHVVEVNAERYNSEVAHDDGNDEAESDEDGECEDDQFPDDLTLDTPQEESPLVQEPPRSTVVVRLSVTTVKVELEEYGMWAMSHDAGSPSTSAPLPHGSNAQPSFSSPTVSKRNARSGNHSQDSDVPHRSVDVPISTDSQDSASRSPAAALMPSEETILPAASGCHSQQRFATSKIYVALEGPILGDRVSESANEEAEDDRKRPAKESPYRTRKQPPGAMQAVLHQLKERACTSSSRLEVTPVHEDEVHSKRQANGVQIYESSEDEDHDPNADESVVEVYSRDPAAAARAAAILKMNYNYIEHGYAIPAATTPRKSTKSNRISLTSSRPCIVGQPTLGKKRMSLAELLHEAEFDLAIGRPLPTIRPGDGSQRTSSPGSMLPMPGALPSSPRRNNRTSPMNSGIIQPPTPPSAHDKPWKRNDWRDLEKAYRRTERRFSKLPQKSTGGTTAPKASSDPDIIIDTFMHMKGLAEEDLRGEWARSVLHMRIQVLDRRMAEHSGLFLEASSPQVGSANAMPSRPRKRARTDDERDEASEIPTSTGLLASTTASRLTTFFKGLQGHLPRPSLSLLSSPIISKTTPLWSSDTSSGREKESATADQPSMRQIHSSPQSVTTTRPSIIAPTFMTPTVTSQHSQAIKALFPNSAPIATTKPIAIPPKAAAKVPVRLSQGSSSGNSPSVKDLIRSFDSFEDVSGLASGDVSGSSLRRVASTSSLRVGKNGGERRLTEH